MRTVPRTITRKNSRRLLFEPLEERALLSVTSAEFDAIRSQYADLNLSANMSDYNLIEIPSDRLTDAAIRNAVAVAGITAENDLIVVRSDKNTVIDFGDQSLEINIDSAVSGGVGIVSFGQNRLQIQSGADSGVVHVLQGDAAFGGIVLCGVEGSQRKSLDPSDLLQTDSAANVQTSQMIKVTENTNRAGHFTLFTDADTESQASPSSGSPIGSKSYSITVGVGGTLEAYLTGLTATEKNSIIAGSISFLSTLNPFDAEKIWSGDRNHCWAGTSSNMLAYAGWGSDKGFQTEDDLFNYFRSNFTDDAGRSYYGNDWFITGNYTPTGWKDWAQPTGSGGLYSDYNIQTVAADVCPMNSASGITNVVNNLKEGSAVGLSLGWFDQYHNRTGGHAITMWGAVYDTAKSNTANDYYVSLLVTDSDDGSGVNAANVLKSLSIEYTSSYTSYRFSSYSGGNGYLENYTWLAQYPLANPVQPTITAQEFDAIRLQYADLNLSVNMSDYNVIEIPSGQLTDAAIRSAIAVAGITAENDLIVVRTTETQNKITLGGTELAINFDSTQFGGVTIVSFGDEKLTIDAGRKSRVFNITNGVTAALAGLTITGGNMSGYGGGISNSDGELTLTHSIVTGNSANNAAGIFNLNSTLRIVNSLIYGNTTSGTGGAIFCDRSVLTVTNSTVTNNTANGTGGIAVYNQTNAGVAATLFNTIVAQNVSLTNFPAVDINNTSSAIIGHNNLTTFTNWGSGSGDNFLYTVNEPLFVDAANGNFLLSEDSQALEGGNSGFALAAGLVADSLDLAGNPRFQGKTIDIGAYESPYEVLPTVVTTALDVVNPDDGMTSLREAIATVRAGGTILFDNTLQDTAIVLNGTQLLIDKSLTIDATGRNITIDADRKSRVLQVTGTVDVSLAGLTITGGNGYPAAQSPVGGGGIFNSGGRLTVADCIITGNSTPMASNAYGGGIFQYQGTLTVVNSMISGNSSYNGGGMAQINGSTMTVTNSLITGNTAYGGGGLFSANSLKVKVTHSTIAGNAATLAGGGGYVLGTAELNNTIVAENTAPNDRDFIARSGEIAGSNNLTTFTGWGKTSDDNLVHDPSKPLFVDAANGDYHLAAGSQAIDAGSNALAVDASGNPLTSDLDGNTRIVGGTADIGAYESSYEPAKETASTVVTTNLDVVDEYDGLISLREAIAYAGTDGLGTAITFDDSLRNAVIVLGGTELRIDKELAITNNLTIDAADLNITIDADQKSRVFIFNNLRNTESKPDISLIGLTLTGGKVGTSSSGGSGAGIYGYGVTLDIMNCRITENTSNSSGGGIYVGGGTVSTITDSTFSGNKAARGGGIFISETATAVITDSVISDNDALRVDSISVHHTGGATLSGGGIYVNNGGTLTITESSVSGNTAEYDGGGIYGYYGKVTITNNTISDNKAFGVNNSSYGNGGGIYTSNNSNSFLTVSNSIITENTANVSGGGIYVNNGGTLTNVTVAGNTASSSGGGIYKYGSTTLYLYNSIVAENSSDIYHSAGAVSGSNNLTTFTAWSGTSVGNVVYNSLKPLFVDAENGDYHLAAGSQAINKGNNALAVDASGNPLTSDLDGNTRIQKGIVDIGAYESAYEPVKETASTVVTTNQDVVDEYDGVISLREAIAYAGTDNLGTAITFDDSL
ncbi:MAG: right-handed parallel beta-helix repeat-containing protein, partial [Planctomycetaceae bacterium]|nr:right-handed parallel beta-helix repeat-containing protein [Planctomycetaceae bacterium]